MKLLILSDAHGRADCIRRAMERQNGTTNTVLFLGDGLDAFEMVRPMFPEWMSLSVCGNCDRANETPEQLIEVEKIKILLLHGHRQHVKSGTGLLAEYARAKGADLCLFGHTHQPYEQYFPPEDGARGLWLFNPGSVGGVRGAEATFGIAEIRGSTILLSHGTL